jgi:hypothetical protein
LKEGILIPVMAALVLALIWQLWSRPLKIGREALEIYDEETGRLDEGDIGEDFNRDLKPKRVRKG